MLKPTNILRSTPASNLFTIENELFQCRIVPHLGGAISFFDCKLGNGQTQPLLRHTSLENTQNILDLSCWPLVPFSNRIKEGAFDFEGIKHKVAKNYPARPHGILCIHGQGWQFPWEVDSSDAHSCTLTFNFDPERKGMAGLWPFPYKAQQHFELHDTGLTQRVSVMNTGKTNMPVGLGVHPYFHKITGTTLQAKTGSFWEVDLEDIPLRSVPTPPEYDFSRPKVLDNVRLDNCFSGYGGLMQVVWPKQPVALNIASSPNLNHVAIYTPQSSDFFCVEPVSHKPNAINDTNWQEGGIVALPAGKTEEAWYKYEALRMPTAPSVLSRLRTWKPLDLG